MTLDHEDIELVARRVADLLDDQAMEPRPLPRLVDAATAARLLGVSRATVYAKADELGAIRVGRGKRARLRFDPRRLFEAGGRPDPPALTIRRRKSAQRASPELLPIRGGRNGSSRDLGS